MPAQGAKLRWEILRGWPNFHLLAYEPGNPTPVAIAMAHLDSLRVREVRRVCRKLARDEFLRRPLPPCP